LNWNRISPALGVPMSLPYVAVPVGATLMLLFLWMDLVIKRHEGSRLSPQTFSQLSSLRPRC
jgi:TRAP-type C4-dicarboxylate transport system permease small subunit